MSSAKFHLFLEVIFLFLFLVYFINFLRPIGLSYYLKLERISINCWFYLGKNGQKQKTYIIFKFLGSCFKVLWSINNIYPKKNCVPCVVMPNMYTLCNI